METEKKQIDEKKKLRTGFTTGGVYAGGGVVSLHRGSTCGGRDSDTFRRPGDSADCPGRAGGR